MHRTRYHFLEETTSTNDEARNPRYGHGDAICAERQTAGRGQRGHTWSSEEGRNLMFSLVWEPRFLPVSEQFLLSEAVALALTSATDNIAIYYIPEYSAPGSNGRTTSMRATASWSAS